MNERRPRTTILGLALLCSATHGWLSSLPGKSFRLGHFEESHAEKNIAQKHYFPQFQSIPIYRSNNNHDEARTILRLFSDGEESSTSSSASDADSSSISQSASIVQPTSSSTSVSGRNSKEDQKINTSTYRDRFFSYLSNIQRVRRILEEDGTVSEALGKSPIHSLVHFLLAQDQGDQKQTRKQHTPQQSRQRAQFANVTNKELISRTVIQAIRLASSLNDYRLILRLVDSALVFVQTNTMRDADRSHEFSLEAQVLSEAVRALCSTSISLAKIRKFWKETHSKFPEVTARELNSMLTVLGDRGKPGAALQLLQTSNLADAYSYSLVLKILRESIDLHKPMDESIAVDDNDQDFDEGEDWLSPCWQWNEGRALLEQSLFDEDMQMWNNVVLSSLLRLNARAYEVFPVKHKGPEFALQILEIMQQNDIKPDVVMCSHVLTCLGQEWKVAIQVLEAMEDTANDWYPEPNEYAYAAAISCCAKARKYHHALEILERLRADNSTIRPNTVVYNSVLQSLKGSITSENKKHPQMEGQQRKFSKKKRSDAEDRVKTAMDLFANMQYDEQHNGFSTQPDRVTFNALLGVLASSSLVIDKKSSVWQDLEEKHRHLLSYEHSDWTFKERLVHSLLDYMEENDIERDGSTYKHAILAVGSEGLVPVVQIVGRVVMDADLVSTELFNTALSVMADVGDLGGMQLLAGRMVRAGCKPSAQTISEIIRCMGNGRKTSSLPVFLLAMTGSADAATHIFEHHQLEMELNKFPPLEHHHYSEAIAAALISSDFENAKRILIQMQEKGIESSDRALESIGRSYAMIARSSASFSNAKALSKAQKENDSARSRALSAYEIVSQLESPSTSLVSLTAKSCAANRMFGEAQQLVRLIHTRMLAEVADRMSSNSNRDFNLDFDRTPEGSRRAIRSLHRSIMHYAAKYGNATAALHLTEDIQYFSRKMSWGMSSHDAGASIRWDSSNATVEVIGVPTRASEDSLGMTLSEWRSLLVAASRSGHWRLCLSTLQFLRPYVEATHPSKSGGDSDRNYQRLAPALSHAIQCMAMRSQYGWIVRSIDDWVEWSGRRPPIKAAHAAFRILCARGRGEETHSLLTRCLYPPPSDPKRDGGSYELSLFVSAITYLHKAGINNVADEVFVDAISSGALPFNLEKQTYGVEHRFTLDLHGMNVAVANSAVRVALQQEVLSASYDAADLWDNDIVVVTGRGKNSALQMRPVLRPEVQRMLTEEFYPPLTTSSVPGNMGALRVPSEDISEWLSHQRQLKGARMLTVAAVLKNLSSGNSIRAAFTKAASQAKEGDGRDDIDGDAES